MALRSWMVDAVHLLSKPADVTRFCGRISNDQGRHPARGHQGARVFHYPAADMSSTLPGSRRLSGALSPGGSSYFPMTSFDIEVKKAFTSQ
jgi:hypothetical protein